MVQLAAERGAHVLATAREDDSLQMLHRWGAVRAIDTRTEPPEASKVDIRWDCTGSIPLADARSPTRCGRW
ncbi:hypothetical protein GCM10012275_46710 [Longimycelium tulufanense]|uniref:Uncharacterized protein n=1 Tax=Longimycelium tulufanense TaxID=907463 RepID=A0A8J3CI96_9PSEU|nr:hypothetical protein [Longimycelium tulufanense]GGM70910.1 hypothetical protein GCM10012275_46710 [Longimycelium tulufanense]